MITFPLGREVAGGPGLGFQTSDSVGTSLAKEPRIPTISRRIGIDKRPWVQNRCWACIVGNGKAALAQDDRGLVFDQTFIE